MKIVYLLKHDYRYILHDNVKSEETRLLGVYETKEKAEAAIEFYKKLPGFKDLFESDFYLSECELNKSYWEEGFPAVDKAGRGFIDYDENFADADDFIDCFNRGCELEFLYNGKHYSVTPFASDNQRKISVMEAYNEDSEVEYDTPREALNYPVGDKRLGDILQEMKIIDRTL